LRIIALSGWARSGKDTVADYLVEHHGYTKVSFADPIRKALYTLNPEIRDISGLVYTFKQAADLFGWELMKEYFPTYRDLMQRMGTEVGRDMFGEDFWVQQALKSIEPGQKVVLSDCRYRNEADAVRSADGVVWRVEREGNYSANDHASERDLDAYLFDLILFNDEGIEELYVDVESGLDG
jgi:hypothetical protein